MILNIPDSVLITQTLVGSAKVLYGFLLAQKNTKNINMCKMSAQTLADTIGVERATIPRLTKALETHGLLKIHEGLSSKNRPQYIYEVLTGLENAE